MFNPGYECVLLRNSGDEYFNQFIGNKVTINYTRVNIRVYQATVEGYGERLVCFSEVHTPEELSEINSIINR